MGEMRPTVLQYTVDHENSNSYVVVTYINGRASMILVCDISYLRSYLANLEAIGYTAAYSLPAYEKAFAEAKAAYDKALAELETAKRNPFISVSNKHSRQTNRLFMPRCLSG